MLMSIPTIVASGVLLGAGVIAEADVQAARDGAIAAGMAFAAALAALVLMMRLLKTVSFTPYVIYRVIPGRDPAMAGIQRCAYDRLSLLALSLLTLNWPDGR